MKALQKFLDDETGATVLETLVVFMPILTMVYANVEVILSFYSVNAAQKASQAAARIAAGQTPIFQGASLYDPATGTVVRNQLNPAYDGAPPCYQPDGAAAACTIPDDSAWVCSGDTVDSDANCDANQFGLLITELQRFFPSVDCADVTVRYIYRGIGFATGPMVPEVQVSIAPRSLPLDLISFTGFATLGENGGGLGAAVSSSLGEDLRNPAGLTPPDYRCVPVADAESVDAGDGSDGDAESGERSGGGGDASAGGNDDGDAGGEDVIDNPEDEDVANPGDDVTTPGGDEDVVGEAAL